MVNFHETAMGRKYYEATMPKIANELHELTAAVNNLTELVAKLTNERCGDEKKEEELKG